ncbi:MAG TPA: acid protease [Leeuwenhoekiella sp.]|nr:acid protease [Leeuwenhoekiella sp.]
MASLRQFLKEKGYHSIKLTETHTGHFKINLKLNGVIGSFILDTGASNTCVDFKAADQFKLFAEDSDVKAAGAGAVDMFTQISSNNTVAIENWSIADVDVVLFDLSHVNTALTDHDILGVDGIIGADILNQAKAVIDYEYHCLYLKDRQ